jgi:hypothetical protein
MFPHSARVVLPGTDGGDTVEQPRFTFTKNFYAPFGEAFIAALTQMVPTTYPVIVAHRFMHVEAKRPQETNAQLLDFKCVEFVEELLYGQYRKHPLNK